LGNARLRKSSVRSVLSSVVTFNIRDMVSKKPSHIFPLGPKILSDIFVCSADKKQSLEGDEGTLLAYVTYAIAQDAKTALETLGGHKLGGRKVFLKFTKTRSEQERPKLVLEEAGDDEMDYGKDTKDKEEEGPGQRSSGVRLRKDQRPEIEGEGDPHFQPLHQRQRQERPKLKPVNKKSRVIIRNLSFKVRAEQFGLDVLGA
jgi:hypothetical protein